MNTKNILKKGAMTALAGAMLIGGAMTAQAAGWQQNATGWWYGTNADNTTWYVNCWQWIDGNGDGVAESYCFDANGYLYTNTTTPDGYTVNADGAWTVNGVVQTKVVSPGSAGGSSGGGASSSTNESNTAASTTTNNASDLQVLNGTYALVKEVIYGQEATQAGLEMLNYTCDIKILENGDMQLTGHNDLLGDADPIVISRTGDREWTDKLGNSEFVFTFPDNNTLKKTDYMRKRYLGEYQGYHLFSRVN